MVPRIPWQTDTYVLKHIISLKHIKWSMNNLISSHISVKMFWTLNTCHIFLSQQRENHENVSKKDFEGLASRLKIEIKLQGDRKGGVNNTLIYISYINFLVFNVQIWYWMLISGLCSWRLMLVLHPCENQIDVLGLISIRWGSYDKVQHCFLLFETYKTQNDFLIFIIFYNF